MFDEGLQLQPFDRLYASVVASWVRDETELFRLAPSTIWPITAAKVVAWTRPTDRPVLLFDGDQSLPRGYAELNPLRELRSHLWIGHVIVDPTQRGNGLGKRFTRLLIEQAFADAHVQKLAMLVVPGNQAALRCYQASGFSVTGSEQHRFRPNHGRQTMLRMEITRQEAVFVPPRTAPQELSL